MSFLFPDKTNQYDFEMYTGRVINIGGGHLESKMNDILGKKT